MNHPLSPDQQYPPALAEGHGAGTSRPAERRGHGQTVLESLAVFALGFAMMHFVYGGTGGASGDEPGVPGHDSFYHIKMASMIPEHGLLDEFPWLRFVYFTDQGQAFVSHHHGFHVLLAPFVYVSKWVTGDYLAGGRWAISTFFGLNLMLCNLILLTQQVRWRWLWLLLFVAMPFQFFTRHAFVRAISPSLMFMLLILLFMFRRRYVLVGLVIAGYTHLYLGGVVYAPLLVGLYIASSLIGPRDDRVMSWRLIAWAAAGWGVGVLTHPYLGGMSEFLRLQIFGSGLSPDISVGREWKPYTDLWWFAQMSGALLLIWAAAVCVRFRLGPPLNAKELAVLLLNFVFLALTMKARRFIEYWPIFCLLSAALMTAPPIGKLAGWVDSIVDPKGPRMMLWLERAGALVVAVAVLGVVFASPLWGDIRRTARCGYDLSAIREAMTFLIEHSDPGDVVFTDDWDIFPVYFYYNSHNHYIVGLDPKFTHARRPDLWERYVKVSRGQVPADVTVNVRDDTGEEVSQNLHVTLADIRDHFGAGFVITDRDHRKLADKLSRAEDLAELVYPSRSYDASRDAPYLIFRIRGEGEGGAALSRTSPGTEKADVIYLSSLAPVSVAQGWGDFVADQSVGGGPIHTGGKVYARGLGTHAPSNLIYGIPDGYDTFEAVVGVNQSTSGQGSIIASVRLDGELAFESPVLTGASEPVAVRVSLGAARRLSLLADPTDDGKQFDHTDWADARFVRSADAD
jgi:hypothetical protein